MLRKVIGNSVLRHQWRTMSSKTSRSKMETGTNVASAIDSMLLRSLKEHYLEVSKMTPPPKVSPPSPFQIVKGSLEDAGPVLTRSNGKEQINLYVMRLAHVVSGGDEDEDDVDDDGINQLFLHVDVSKPHQAESLHFFCGLYPDALGIHSISMRPKLENSVFLDDTSKYVGPSFEELDEKMRDACHAYLDNRGINENLFPFLQAWLYVKDHRNLLRWFKTVGTVILGKTPEKKAE